MFPSRDLAGRVTEMRWMIRDITERRQAEEELRQSEARFRRIFDCKMVPMGIWTIAGGIVEANDTLLDLIGYTRQELETGQINWQVLTPVEYWTLDRNALSEIATQGFSSSYEKVYVHKDGRLIPILIGAASFLDDPNSGVFFVIDLTVRKQTEAQLREAHVHLESALAAGAIYTWRWQIPEDLVIVNAALAHLFGVDPELAALGLPIELFVRAMHEDDRPRVVAAINQAIEAGEDYATEYRVHTADGEERWLAARGRVEYDADGRPLAFPGALADITARKCAELQLQQQAFELIELNKAYEQTTSKLSERNQELDRFVYTVSHDLKAPLRAIPQGSASQHANLSQWLCDDLKGKLEAEHQHQLELLQSRVYRMEATIDGLLTYSRVGRIEVATEMVDVGELLAEILDSLMPPPTFIISIQSEMPTIIARRLLLSQVFSNLIGNAIAHCDRSDGRLEIRATQKGEYYEFSIADNGKGIAPENHDRVFDIFQTLKGQNGQGSTGIGLSIVKKILEAEGGSIVLESDLGRGATFRFTWGGASKSTK